MFPQTLYPQTRQVLDKLIDSGVLENFYLAGGTGLALQLGHRKSIDLDFFTPNFPKRDLLLSKIKDLNPKIIQEAPETIDCFIDNVKVSFLEYKYPLIDSLVDFEALKVAAISDIACMKLSAISSRGSKKDLIDLYFILKGVALKTLIEKFENKFKGIDYQKLHILKSIVYFEDADNEPDPDMITPANWNIIKEILEKETMKILNYAQ